MIDKMDDHEEIQDDIENLDALIDAVVAVETNKKTREKVMLPKGPLFQVLFRQSIKRDDIVLRDFAEHVVGALSDRFGTVAAKGGAFFRQKEAERAKNTDRYRRDQTLRGHLINGMLPTLHIARYLKQWAAKPMRHYDDVAERLFIAGFMLHDYTKIPDVKKALKDAGFAEMEAPSAGKMPKLEEIFREWCDHLGLNAFLVPIGGAALYIQDLIYIAHNTQILSGTVHAPFLLPNTHTSFDVHDLATKLSRMADLLAYVARTPRDLVAHPAIQEVLRELAAPYNKLDKQIARLTYHHVAENRGLLLNFIHNEALEALKVEDTRIPLLFAPSGIVYLEHFNAPPMPAIDDLTRKIVGRIRSQAASELITTGKGAKRGNVGLLVDDSYRDFFELPDFVRQSTQLVDKLIRNNKSAGRLAPVQDNGWPGGDHIPALSTDPKDSRVDQIAEWAGLMEVQFRERLPGFNMAAWLLNALEIGDLATEFQALRDYPDAKKGGIKYWWFWAAAHAVARKPGLQPYEPNDPDNPDRSVSGWLKWLARGLADALPDVEALPGSARVNEDTWNDLADYIERVLTLGGAKSVQTAQPSGELNRYGRAKGGRAKTICAICGGDYITRKPAETTVSFQPGVYTARIRIGSSDNGRSLCSICALEQLLRQLFMTNLDTGGTVEEQRVRYLSLYPSYFFTPETLTLVNRLCSRIQDMRLSDKDFREALQSTENLHSPAFIKPDELTRTVPRLQSTENLYSPAFWQRLEPFLMRAENEVTSRRVLRYNTRFQSTFMTIGFRNFNKPTDTESWVLPAFLALLLPILLDVKVVISESGTPLLVEADELAETVWFDGAHAAIQALTQEDHIHVDAVLPTLQRLIAAYMIHLDTEYAPPKEQWQRLTPIANALMESPLYVFHYLKKQERDGKFVSFEQVHRYVHYAEMLFNQQGDLSMSKAQELVQLYRGFYRAKNTNSNSILRPLSVVADALLIADMELFDSDEALVELAFGELYRFMDRVGKGLADGRFPKGISAQERERNMRAFCRFFVVDVFKGIFRGDVAALRGKQLNLLRSACEVLYRDKQAAEWEVRGQSAEEGEITDENNTDASEN